MHDAKRRRHRRRGRTHRTCDCVRACAARRERSRLRTWRAGARGVVGRRRNAGAVYRAHYQRGVARALRVFARAVSGRSRERVRDAGGIDARLRLDGVLYAAFEAEGLEFAAPAWRATRHARRRVRDGRSRRSARCRTVVGRRSSRRPCSSVPKVTSTTAGSGARSSRHARRAGVRVEQSVTICGGMRPRRVLGVRTDRGFVGARAVVNACGAWAAQLARASARLRSADRAGQGTNDRAQRSGRLRAARDVGSRRLSRSARRRAVARSARPWRAAGFDDRVTADGIHELLHAALGAAPSLGDLHGDRELGGVASGNARWACRSSARRRSTGILLATGHYRNGILLAPATARLIADAIETGEYTALAPFLLARSRHGRRPVERMSIRMKATINGQLRDLPDELTVAALLEVLGSPRNGVAVARNDRVVRRAEYELRTTLRRRPRRDHRSGRGGLSDAMTSDSAQDRKIRARFALDRRNRKVSVDGSDAGRARRKRCGDGDGCDSAHQSRRCGGKDAARLHRSRAATRFFRIPPAVIRPRTPC